MMELLRSLYAQGQIMNTKSTDHALTEDGVLCQQAEGFKEA